MQSVLCVRGFFLWKVRVQRLWSGRHQHLQTSERGGSLAVASTEKPFQGLCATIDAALEAASAPVDSL